jgi:hypothetical protein
MPYHAIHPIQDLFLESFSYVLQIDMHFICTPMWTKKIYSCKNWVLQPSYNTTSFNYDSLPSNHSFTYMHVGKLSHFDGMNYIKWHHAMKVHLILLYSSIWKVVFIGVEFLEDGETLDYNQLQQIHYNAQATNVLLSSLQMRYGKYVECFMKELSLFGRPRLRCLRGNLIGS